MASKAYIGLLGGGTGGHIYPLIAVAQAINKIVSSGNDPVQSTDVDHGASIRYFGEPGTYKKLLHEQGITVSHIASSKLRRYSSILNFLDFFKFFFGFFQALFKLYVFMPDVMFSKSGPGVLPIVYAARWYRIPLIIHESDAVPGLTNLASSKHAKIVELAFENARQYFTKHTHVSVVGLPVRESVISKESMALSRTALGLSDAKPILLFLGGSQGSARINEFVLEHSEFLLSRYEIIHQVGAANYESYKAEFDFMTKNYRPELKANYFLHPFLDDQTLARAFASADLVISRAGSSIFEIAANGKPAILIPLVNSANDHQFANAYAYSQAGAGVVMEEENLLPGIFTTQVDKILGDEQLRKSMSQAAKNFYKLDAADVIARDIINVARA